MMNSRRSLLAVVAVTTLIGVSCGGSDGASSPVSAPDVDVEIEPTPAGAQAGVRVVSAEQASATLADPPDELIVLDVRTQEEFDEGHIEGAVLLDFYRDDFADELAKLDPDAPYLIYCRSGNRSGQTRALMAELGFAAVDDVDGGIVDWQQTGLPVTLD